VSTPVVAFFNNKGGVGKTSLVYHLSWMYADIGARVVVADLDPQANLTAAFLDDDQIEQLWLDDTRRPTVFGAIEPLLRGVGDILDEPYVETVEERIHLLPGDLALAQFEDELSHEWPLCMDRKERAFRVVSAFWRLIQKAAGLVAGDFALMDLGPNLGAINRAALIAADYLVVPLAADLFSLQGLKNLGPTVRTWRGEWTDRRSRNPVPGLDLPPGQIRPVGYVVMQHAVRLDRPVKAYDRWAARIPEVYSEQVLGQKPSSLASGDDGNRVGQVKHYRSLMPMAQEARKPMFHLSSADGAIGAHAKAVVEARVNFRQLADEVAKRCGLRMTSSVRRAL